MWQKFKLIFCLKCIASFLGSSNFPYGSLVLPPSNYAFDTCRTRGESPGICRGHPSCHIRLGHVARTKSLHLLPPLGQVKGDRWADSEHRCKIHNAAGRQERSKCDGQWNQCNHRGHHRRHQQQRVRRRRRGQLWLVIKGRKKPEISLQLKPTKMLSPNGISFSLFYTLLCSILSFFLSDIW